MYEMCKNVKEGKREKERESIKWDKKHLGWDREVVTVREIGD